jgi:hypothetical protein
MLRGIVTSPMIRGLVLINTMIAMTEVDHRAPVQGSDRVEQ